MNKEQIFPKKRIAAGGLIMNEGKVLLVKPTYKKHWSFVGGIIEDFESIVEGLKREIKEETGLDMEPRKPLVFEYLYREEKGKRDESLQIIFLCELQEGQSFLDIKIPGKELEEYGFFSPQKGIEIMSETGGNRLRVSLEALKNKNVIYIETGN